MCVCACRAESFEKSIETTQEHTAANDAHFLRTTAPICFEVKLAQRDGVHAFHAGVLWVAGKETENLKRTVRLLPSSRAKSKEILELRKKRRRRGQQRLDSLLRVKGRNKERSCDLLGGWRRPWLLGSAIPEGNSCRRELVDMPGQCTCVKGLCPPVKL